MRRPLLTLLFALSLGCGGTARIGAPDDEQPPTEDSEAPAETDPAETDPTDSEPDDSEPSDTDPNAPPAALLDPSATGPFSFTTATPTPTLSTRTRLLVRVFLPDGPGPFPIVVFTHGFQLTSSDYRSYGRHLASWGYVVLMPDLPGSLLDAPTHLELAEELTALLDWASAGPTVLQGRADPGSVALAGHSMGGKLSFLVATTDDRVDAIFGVDPVDAGGNPFFEDPVNYPSVTPERMDDIDVPIGMVGETLNGAAALGPACAPAEDNFAQYLTHASSPAVAIEIVGANHMSFLDNPSCGLPCLACPRGTDNTNRTRELAQRYLTAFLELTLRNRAGYRTYLAGPGLQGEVAAGEVVLTGTANGF